MARSRERVDVMRRQQPGAARRRHHTVVVSVVGAVLALVVGVGIAVQAGRSGPDPGRDRAPLGAVEDFSVPRGQPSAPVTLTVYEDFWCPACRALEEHLDRTIDEYVEQGRIRVLYRPIALLDETTTDYSSRAMESAGCVLDAEGPGAFVRMHDLLLTDQPVEAAGGLDDEALVDLAARAGADPEAITQCISDGRFTGWVTSATEQASLDGVDATPTILVNDQRLELTADEDPAVTLRRAVDAAS